MKNHLNLNDHPRESNWIKYGTTTLRIIRKCFKKRKKEGEEWISFMTWYAVIWIYCHGQGEKARYKTVVWGGGWWFHQNKAWEEKSRNSKLFAIVWMRRKHVEKGGISFEYNLWYSLAFEPCKLNKEEYNPKIENKQKNNPILQQINNVIHRENNWFK